MIKFYELCSLRSVESDGGADCGGDFFTGQKGRNYGQIEHHRHFGCQWNVRKVYLGF